MHPETLPSCPHLFPTLAVRLGFCNGMTTSSIAMRCIFDMGGIELQHLTYDTFKVWEHIQLIMVGILVRHMRNSARSVIWTMGLSKSANSVQAITVLCTTQRSSTRYSKTIYSTHLEVSCPARRNVGTSRLDH